MKKLMLIVMVICIMLTGCVADFGNVQDNIESSSEQSITTSTPKPTSKPRPTPTPTPEPKIYISEDEIPFLYTNTYAYIGDYEKLTGKVFAEPERDEDAVYIQMFQDPENSENNTIVIYSGDSEVKQDDYIYIDGRVYDLFEGENAFGGTVTAPRIVAGMLEIKTYQEVMVPTEKTIEIDEKQEQYGYEVILEKVEFAESETRVYLTINNNGVSNFSVYTFNMKLIQNKNQYEEQSNWEADYPEIKTDLYPDTTSRGIMCFPAISQTDDFALYIDGSSDDWNEDIEEYKFEISINE